MIIINSPDYTIIFGFYTFSFFVLHGRLSKITFPQIVKVIKQKKKKQKQANKQTKPKKNKYWPNKNFCV